MKRTVISAAVLALAISGAGVASAEKPEDAGNGGAPTGFKVTGGGQIIADPEAEGPGDTVGFNAQEIEGDDEASPGDDDDAARGQFQYVPRAPEEGGNQPVNEKFHGVVTCLISGGEAEANEDAETGEDEPYKEQLTSGMARFGGHFRDDPTRFFTVDVTDNGNNGEEDDLILVRETKAPCADNPEDEQAHNPEALLRLGRGNVKIHNNPDGETPPPAAIALAHAKMIKMAAGL